jgi:hypothetical protein
MLWNCKTLQPRIFYSLWNVVVRLSGTAEVPFDVPRELSVDPPADAARDLTFDVR